MHVHEGRALWQGEEVLITHTREGSGVQDLWIFQAGYLLSCFFKNKVTG